MLRVSISGKVRTKTDKVEFYIDGSDPKQVANAYKNLLEELSSDKVVQPRKRVRIVTTVSKGGMKADASNGQE